MTYKKISNDPYLRSSNSIFPYVNIGKVFTDEQIDLILKSINTGELETAKTFGDSTPFDTRRSKISFLDPSNENLWIFNQINNVVDEANDKFYNFCLNGYQSIQYTEYRSEDNGFYEEHTDMSFGSPDMNSHESGVRKLSLVVFLSDSTEYSGGQFVINLGGKECDKIVVDQRKGGGIIFPSFLLHKVFPVNSGIRKTLVTWITGPRFV